MLKELEERKEKYKEEFSKFQGKDMSKQKQALKYQHCNKRKLKAQGIRSEALKKTIALIEKEEADAIKAKQKKNDENEM